MPDCLKAALAKLSDEELQEVMTWFDTQGDAVEATVVECDELLCQRAGTGES